MDPMKSIRRAVGSARRRGGISDAGLRSQRLTFAYDERGVRLIRRTLRSKAAPPSDPLDGLPNEKDVVAEVRSAAGVTIYRRAIRGALPIDVEVFEPDGTMRREALVQKDGVFTVVVGNDKAADHVVVDAGPQVEIPHFEVPEDAQQRNGRVQLGRFRLDVDLEEED